mgnify:CR=1 FL=1
MIDKNLFSIFKQGSKTYFYSSLFFPKYIKEEVFSLYAFVRKADNYVDSIPQNIQGFYEFKDSYEKAINGYRIDDVVIDSFVNLVNKRQINHDWVESFLKSMEMDITKKEYKNIQETLKYVYGSAEVIGLMMAKIMNLSDESFYYAKYLGRSMQYINFIRDISEDAKLGRKYFPKDELMKYKLSSLDYEYTKEHSENFKNFIHHQLSRYCLWQDIAEEGYKFIPKRYLIPVKTASEMYNWTATQIYKNPFVVYNKKVKPMIKQIFTTIFLNVIDPEKPNYRLNIRPLPEPTPKINL